MIRYEYREMQVATKTSARFVEIFEISTSASAIQL